MGTLDRVGERGLVPDNSNHPETAMKYLLLPLTLLLTANHVAAQIHWTTETFGAPSGVKAEKNAGLILEVTNPRGSAPALRLFGGHPGNEARIFVSANPDADPRVAAAEDQVFDGVFDEDSLFTVLLSDVVVRPQPGWYAHGIECSRRSEFAPPRYELSQGVFAAVAEEPTYGPEDLLSSAPVSEDILPVMWPTSFDELQAAIDGWQPIEDLRGALNSAGDSIELHYGQGMSGGLVLFAGGNGSGTVTITRTDTDQYELSAGLELLGAIGLELSDESGLSFEVGLGREDVLRFHSVDGLWRALTISPDDIARSIGDELGTDWVQPVEDVEEAYLAALLALEEAERVAVAAARDAEAAARKAEGAMRDGARAAQRRLQAARRLLAKLRRQLERAMFGRPLLRAAVKMGENALKTAERSYGEALGRLREARKAAQRLSAEAERVQALVVGEARHTVAQAQAALEAAMANAMIAAEIADYRGELCGYVRSHSAGCMYEVIGTAEAGLAVPLAGTTPALGAGVGAGGEYLYTCRVDYPESLGGPLVVSKSSSVAVGADIAAALSIGFNGDVVLGLRETVTSTVLSGEWFDDVDEERQTFELFLELGEGAVLSSSPWTTGSLSFGRSMAVSMDSQSFTTIAELLMEGESLVDVFQTTFADTTFAYGHQDHVSWGTLMGVGLSIAGNGGFTEGHVLQQDCGPNVGWSLTGADIVDTIESALTGAPTGPGDRGEETPTE